MKYDHDLKNDSIEHALRGAGLTDSSGNSTPRNAADAVIMQILGPKANLLSKRKKPAKRPSRRSPNEQERKLADDTRSRHSKSLNGIAVLLGAEGFNEHTVASVLYYARHNIWGKEFADQINDKKKAMAMALNDLLPEQKKIIGKTMHHFNEAMFQTGLRVGLMASLWTLLLATERSGSEHDD